MEVSALITLILSLAATLYTLLRNEFFQNKREASGLSVSIQFQDPLLPEGFEAPDEPGEWSDFDMIAKLQNSSTTAFYSVIASKYLPSRDSHFLASAEIIEPGQTLYARLATVDVCDMISPQAGAKLTFIDSSGTAWMRNNSGQLFKRDFRLSFASIDSYQNDRQLSTTSSSNGDLPTGKKLPLWAKRVRQFPWYAIERLSRGHLQSEPKECRFRKYPREYYKIFDRREKAAMLHGVVEIAAQDGMITCCDEEGVPVEVADHFQLDHKVQKDIDQSIPPRRINPQLDD